MKKITHLTCLPIWFLIILLFFSAAPAIPVKAEGLVGPITASAETVAVGKTVSITFLSVPAVTISAYQVTIHFDTAKFDFVSGSDLTGLNGAAAVDNNGSTISVYAYGDTGIANVSKLCKLTFRAKAEGSGVFTTSDVVINSESPASSSVTVTVTASGATSAATSAATTAPTTAVTSVTAPTLELSDGTYTVVPMPQSLAVPAGFYRTAIAIGGIQMEAFKSKKGDLVLIYLDQETSGTGLYFYDSNANAVYAYKPFSIPGHDFALIRPDASAVVPEGFTATSLTLDDQTINCWKKADISGDQDPYANVYLLYLLDSEGQKGFFLYNPFRQMIFPYLMLEAPAVSPTTAASSAGGADPVAAGSEAAAGQAGGVTSRNTINPWMTATLILGLLSLMLLAFLIWTYFTYVRPTGEDQGGEPEGKVKPPKIRRVD